MPTIGLARRHKPVVTGHLISLSEPQKKKSRNNSGLTGPSSLNSHNLARHQLISVDRQPRADRAPRREPGGRPLTSHPLPGLSVDATLTLHAQCKFINILPRRAQTAPSLSQCPHCMTSPTSPTNSSLPTADQLRAKPTGLPPTPHAPKTNQPQQPIRSLGRTTRGKCGRNSDPSARNFHSSTATLTQRKKQVSSLNRSLCLCPRGPPCFFAFQHSSCVVHDGRA